MINRPADRSLRREQIPVSVQPDVVVIESGVVTAFLKDSIEEYLESLRTAAAEGVPQHLPRAWGLLFGRIDGDVMCIESIRYAANVRETGEHVLAEFDETIVPCFGKPYANKGRGFWCDSAELLRVTREAEAEGLEMLGSVHMHPDWHRIGPPHERRQRLSEQPTDMDEYLFRNTGWPINMICYLEGRGDEIVHTFAAWSPPPFDESESHATALPIRFGLTSISDWADE
jgi:hypothetical protein